MGIEGTHHLVELKVQCTNQRNEVSFPGTDPRSPAFVTRGANMMAEVADRMRRNQRA
jgi:hypothetical protein